MIPDLVTFFTKFGTTLTNRPFIFEEYFISMCNYQTLSYDDHYGYILLCQQCQYIQFGFGCVLINFVKNEFEGFKGVIEDIILDYSGAPDSKVKTITIPSPCEGLSLYLSIIELRILHRMIDEAETNLRANALVELFSAPLS